MFLKYLLDFEFLFFVFFSRNLFLEGGFMFQWWVLFFTWKGSIIKWGRGGIAPWEGVEKNCRMGGNPVMVE